MNGENEGIYILFKQQNFWFAFPSNYLVNIIRYPDKIVEKDNRVLVRDEELDIIFFDQFMGDQREDVPISQCNILVLDGQQGKVGLVIDHAEEVINLENSSVYPIIPLILRGAQNMFVGITPFKDTLVTVLDHNVLYESCIHGQSGTKKEVLNDAQDLTG